MTERVRRFLEACEIDRNLSPLTIRQYDHYLNHLLSWLAREEPGVVDRPFAPVDLTALARDVIGDFAAVAATKTVDLGMAETQSSVAPVVVQGDVDALRTLVSNLVDNACKYAPRGGRVAVTVSGDGGRVRLAVEDSGPGIAASERPRIFDRFHRATTSQGGAGLGLAIADAIVRATGGRWKVASAPAGGARMGISWSRALA